MKLASYLCEKNVRFFSRVKQGRYIQKEGEEFKHLSECGLVPGTSFYLRVVKVTKQKAFGQFDIAGYWRRKYRDSCENEGWYLLTNIRSLKKLYRRLNVELVSKPCLKTVKQSATI
ncbi:hypothetical protein [Tychonema sp. LEGE 07203]|uniref:hypothetical protein n=1 Tax=Tychonema sp. LEGE 07203 TaxID=1828671 RepID=UPI00187EEA0B|nr:hypothetical protein [Tychonema sp. LEGE 07203]MBE9097820.1 hypothetical protein [Tychonema sp. LEGE 07203]